MSLYHKFPLDKKAKILTKGVDWKQILYLTPPLPAFTTRSRSTRRAETPKCWIIEFPQGFFFK